MSISKQCRAHDLINYVLPHAGSCKGEGCVCGRWGVKVTEIFSPIKSAWNTVYNNVGGWEKMGMTTVAKW